jgi:serine/threonine protein kinase
MTPEFDVIGPYQVVRVLGQGGMGTVYQGVNTKTQESVAIKVIAASLAQHQRFRRRFDAEIQTLIKLKHPNIVQLIGFGEEKGMLFYSMEYVDGENLQQILRRDKQLPWERVVDMAIEVCSALKHAHDFGIIHRDLKPANLMLNSQGKTKLTDFGIAKLFGANDATVEGSVLGTADYMPPEQAEGKPVSVRSDIYSLGSICYAALAGRPPFLGKTIPEILFNVRYGNLTPLSQLAQDVPSELSVLVEEMLRREPSMRPPTGLVVGNRLQSLRAGLQRRALEKQNEGMADVGNMRELTSIDIQNEPLPKGPSSRSPENETVVAPNLSRLDRAQRTESAGNVPSARDAMTRVNDPASIAGPDDRTRVASGKPIDDEDSHFELGRPSGIDHMSKTNFTEVGENERRRSTIVFNEPEPTSHWNQAVGIGGLVAALLACGFCIFWFTRPPSANQLYRELSVAMQSGEDDQMLGVETVAEKFQTLYANDPRSEEVGLFLNEIDNLRTIRQLQRKARRGGTDQLDPVEQAFLECIKAQEVDSELAKRKLQAITTVFASSEKLSSRQKLFVDQAKRMLEKLKSSPSTGRNPAISALEEQMNWAEANLSKSAREDWLKSVIELFQEKPWARDLVSLAKQRLSQ